MFSKLLEWWTWTKWKWRARHRRGANLRVGNLTSFFKALNDANVTYLVLRWFDEIPLDHVAEKHYSGDLDIMVDSKDFKIFACIAARHRGKIKIDLYSEGVQMGTGYAKLPYYPPPKAYELLANRELYADTFYVPTPIYHLRSLCYHICYHKGILSGLDDGLTGNHNEIPQTHDITKSLSKIAIQANVQIPTEVTLFSLHNWLTEQGWNMPYDLVAHWGKKNLWHHQLQSWLESQLEKQKDDMHDMLVFFIRQDAIDNHAEHLILQRLAEHFTIRDIVQLTDIQKQRVMNQTRGADWTLHKSKIMIEPVIAVICHDPNPRPIPPDSKLAKIHFNVKNANVFYKQELRAELEQKFSSVGNFLHGSDNDLESLEYMIAIYGDKNIPAKVKE